MPATSSQDAQLAYPKPTSHHKQHQKPNRKRQHSEVDPTRYQPLRLALRTHQLVPFTHPVSGSTLSPDSTHSAVKAALDALDHPRQLDTPTVKMLDAALAAMHTNQAGVTPTPSYSRDRARNP